MDGPLRNKSLCSTPIWYVCTSFDSYLNEDFEEEENEDFFQCLGLKLYIAHLILDRSLCIGFFILF